ncbi:MAG: dicarboxylate/amino acid:cation symporter [Alistipes sp.]|nr:dicarboxylate/amino acid:cation symporter [Alistipes sp.]
MKKIRIPFYLQILIGMVVGVVVGFIAIGLGGEQIVNDWIRPLGKLFIKALVLIAVPLVFVTLMKGIIDLKDTSSLSRLGGRTVAIYLATTVFAVLVGMGLALLIRPGEMVDSNIISELTSENSSKALSIQAMQADTADSGPLRFLDDIVPSNIFQSLSDNGKMLQIIFFAILFGIAVLSIPYEKKLPLVNLIDSLNEAIMRIVGYVIACAPVGVAALMAGLVVDFKGDASVFAALGVYAGNVVVGMLFMLLVFYPLIARLFGGVRYGFFVKSLYPLQMFAFTTSSSAASLPFTFATTQGKLGVSREVSSFVLPIGTTINMDGTSCYQTIATLFIAQALGIDLTVTQLLTIIVMTTLSSIGTPAIPGGSYVILAMVLTSVGIPAESLALIIGIDRPLDMLRTSVNVTGDVAVSVIMDKQNKNRK